MSSMSRARRPICRSATWCRPRQPTITRPLPFGGGFVTTREMVRAFGDVDRPPFGTDVELRAWLKAEGLEHLLRVSIEVLAPRLDEALRAQLNAAGRFRSVCELASDEAMARWRRTLPSCAGLLERIPRLIWAHLDEERAHAIEARAAIPARLQPPAAPRALTIHPLLCALRSRMPASVAPRPSSALRPEALRFDPRLPGFRFHEEHRVLRSFDLVVPEVTLTLAPSEAKLACSCGASFCVHGLAAIDTALSWLAGAADDD